MIRRSVVDSCIWAFGIAAALSGCVSIAPVTVAAPPGVRGVPTGMQYLYGSGEVAAISRQAYAALTTYVSGRSRMHWPVGGGPTVRMLPQSVVLASDATLAAPRFVDCVGKRPAIVLDVDETALLNTGYEYADAASGLPYDAARWERWERSDGRASGAVPGAVDALKAIRALGVTVIFNSNRTAVNARYTEAALTRAGLGPVRHGETLFLKGDAPGGSAKDPRRAIIAARYCVIAMVGDQLGDMTDLFNAGLTPAQRRSATAAPEVAGLWGNGWFLLTNPVYGTALAGDYDAVFPTDQRWVDPGTTKE